MDLGDFRTILGKSGVDIMDFIKTAIKVASLDYGDKLALKSDKAMELFQIYK